MSNGVSGVTSWLASWCSPGRWGCARPLGGQTEPVGIPENARSKLLRDAVPIALLNGDGRPYNLEAVATTYGQVTEGKDFVQPASTPVYVVAMVASSPHPTTL